MTIFCKNNKMKKIYLRRKKIYLKRKKKINKKLSKNALFVLSKKDRIALFHVAILNTVKNVFKGYYKKMEYVLNVDYLFQEV